MSKEKMLAIYEKYKAVTNGVPSARTPDEIKALAANQDFRRLKDQGEFYMARIHRLSKVNNEMSETHFGETNLDRFEVHQLVDGNTPEAADLNQDFIDMQYSPKGQRLLADRAIRNTLGQDLSIAYPESIEQAFQMAADNPSITEQMWAVTKLNESNKAYKLDPLIQEQLKYNTTAMEGAGFCTVAASYYGSELTTLFKETFGAADLAVVGDNIPKAKLPAEENDKIMSFALNAFKFNGENTDARKETIRKLKQEGIIGPDSMFYRAYDNTGKRIAFDEAVNQLIGGQNVEFRKMDEAEQKKMREALKNPTVAAPAANPGPLFGKDFQTVCKNIYNNLNNMDSSFIRSSAEYREIKQALKEMSERKTFPNAEESKKMLRTVLGKAAVYVKRKSVEAEGGSLSQYGLDRLAAMRNLQAALAPKLGELAYSSYIAKTAAREIHTENQNRMTQAMEARARMERNAQMEQPRRTAPAITVAEKDRGTVFERLAQQANIGMAGVSSAMKAGAAADPQFTNGRYLAQMLAYNLVVNEREKAANGAPGPMEQLLNKVGSKAFYKGIQNSEPMKELIKGGITAEKIRAFIAGHKDRDMMAQLKKPENVQKITQSAEKYAETQKQAAKAAGK